MSELVFPENASKGIVGSMPTFFWGEMYVNFSYLGIIIPPIFVGFFLYFLNVLIFKLQMTPITLSIFVWTIFHYRALSGSSLSGYLIDLNLIVIVLTLICFTLLFNKGKVKYFKRKKII